MNFPTKDHWRSVSNLRDIIEGLAHVADHYKEWGITSMAFPPLGCGQGQLDWKIVGPVMHERLSQLDIPVEIYAPIGTPENQMTESFLRSAAPHRDTEATQSIDPAWVCLVEILSRVLAHRYHWPVGRTVFQKIAYVATKEGLPTKIEFVRASFGPFSPQVKGILVRLVANGLVRERQIGRMFSLETGQSFPQARCTYESELKRWDPTISKVVDLFLRVDTALAEVVSTVLFAAGEFDHKKVTPTDEMIIDSVLEWKERRRPPLDRSIVTGAVYDLGALGWLEFTPTQAAGSDDEV